MNHYEILGVSKKATPAEIKKAYKRMAKKHHPDRNGGDNTQMVLVNKAYDTLMDPAKREHYDLTGEDKPVTPIDVEAKNSLLSLFAQLFNDSRRTKFNIPNRARTVVSQVQVKKTRERAENVAFIEEVKRRRDEVTVAEGEENLWLQLLDSQIAEFQGKVAKNDHELAVTKRSLEMLAAYRSGVIDSPRQTVSGGGLFEHLTRTRGLREGRPQETPRLQPRQSCLQAVRAETGRRGGTAPPRS
jgi:curved DNA-binding protein CbpA